MRDPSTRRNFLNSLEKGVSTFPPNLKLFIAIRPETTFSRKLSSSLLRHIIDIQSSDNRSDIQKYVDMRLPEVVEDHCDLSGTDWPSEEAKKKLVDRAGGLFIWITTACAFLEKSFDPEERLQLLLDGSVDDSAETNLDKLYATALAHVYVQEDPQFIRAFQAIIGAVLAVEDPLASEALEKLIGNKSVGRIQTLLSCVVSCGDEEGGKWGKRVKVLRVIHPSFFRFLTSAERCLDKRFLVDLTRQHITLVQATLNCMLSLLRHDICSIGNTKLLNKDVHDLNSRVGQNIPEELRYSCRFWAHRLSKARKPDEDGVVLGLVKKLFEDKFLNWVEASSLFGKVGDVGKSIRLVLEWLSVSGAL
jgi:hypothetical protein